MPEPRKHCQQQQRRGGRETIVTIAALLVFICGVTLLGWLHHPVLAVRIFACGLIILGLIRALLRKHQTWLRARTWWADALFLSGTGIIMLLLARYAGVIMPTPPLF